METDFDETNEPTTISGTISEATIRSTAKRPTAMRILIFLNKNSDIYTTTEIADELDLEWTTADYNLQKLLDCEFVRIVEDKMDGRTHYYQLVDKKNVEKAISQFKKWVRYSLAHLIPYKKIPAEHVKADKRFIEECQKYGLTIFEGIEAVQSCPKIGFINQSGKTVLWRKEQGYLPSDEKEPEEV
jgi:predicted transcriptional regulator